MNEKQQQLTFDKGITNVPSDALCSDNALADSLGMVYKDGEYKPIQSPALFASIDTSGVTDTVTSLHVLYIHRFNNQERYIVEVNGYIAYGDKEETQQGSSIVLRGWLWSVMDADMVDDENDHDLKYDANTQVTSVGKTLVITNGDGMNYYLWKNEYEVTHGSTTWGNRMFAYFGNGIPAPKVMLNLYGDNSSTYRKEVEQRLVGVYEYDGRYYIDPTQQSAYNDLVIGEYSKLKNDLSKEEIFWGSFSVRVALELYDGSFYHVSNPILMFNRFRNDVLVEIISGLTMKMELRGQKLNYKLLTDYSDYKDIVRNVVLFVSQQQDWFDTTKDCILEDRSQGQYKETRITLNDKIYNHGSITSGPNYAVLQPKPADDFSKALYENGVFRKLCDIGTTPNEEWKDTREVIDSQTILNLSTQQRLENDDYYSHAMMSGDYLYSYNMRLCIAGIRRGFFEGFENFIGYDSYDNQEPKQAIISNYIIYVRIETNSGTRVVKKEFATAQKQGIWFYYPDPRANWVTIMKNDTCILDTQLTEHQALNGAYYFQGMLSAADDDEPNGLDEHGDPISPTLTDNDVDVSPEYITNQMAVSEVNNAIAFYSTGYYTVGNGRILGIASQTKALSQGQFGQYPLLAFTTEGIWALSVSREGHFDTCQPMSREIPLEENPCITQIDELIVFASSKGLMCVDGSVVRCVSEQLTTIAPFLRNAFICYDYKNSLLWLIKKVPLTALAQTCFVYSLKSGTFAHYENGSSIFVGSVNFYPDTLLYSKDNKLHSFMQMPIEEEDNNRYLGTLETRPMKLENALALKSILQIRHICQFSPYIVTETHEDPETHENVETTETRRGTMSLHIYASNNLDTEPNSWVELHSLRGTPWKYYRFRFDFANMKATDRFAGTMLITQERRTNKLR